MLPLLASDTIHRRFEMPLTPLEGRAELRDALAFATRSIHGGPGPDPTTGAILTPIHQSTTYVQEEVGLL